MAQYIIATNSRRFFAGLIDIVIIIPFVLMIAFFAGLPLLVTMQEYTPYERAVYFVIYLSSAFLCFAMATFQIINYSNTIGKRLLRIRVAHLDGGTANLHHVLKRNIAVQGLFALVFLPGPLIASIFENSPAAISFVALALSLIVVPVALLKRTGTPALSWHQRWSRTLSVDERNEGFSQE